MPFERPTLTQIANRIQSDMEQNLSGSSTLLKRSAVRLLSISIAGAFHLMYGFLVWMSRQLFATTADEEYLSVLSAEEGVVRKDAVAATGSATATGTNGTVIPVGTQCQTVAGVIYSSTVEATIAGGIATVSLEADEAGADGNESGGVELTLVSPISGLDSVLTLDSDGMTGGLDLESLEAWRARVLNRKREPPHGGAEFDYENWALEVPGVTRAWAIPLYQGVGTIGVAFVRDDDDDIIPDEAERQTVRDYLVSHEDPATGDQVGIPVTAEPGLVMISLSKLAVAMTIAIYPNTAAVRAAVVTELEAAIKSQGGPDTVLYLSRLGDAISGADGEVRHRIESPLADVSADANQVHVISSGNIIFLDY